MALHFSANQYEKEFHSKRLQNWEVPKVHREEVNPKFKHLPNVDAERPRTQEGYTEIIATDRGHLKGGVPRSKESPWGTFVGTWDLKGHMIGNNVSNPTARATPAINRHHQMVLDGDDLPQVKTPVNHKIDLSKKASESEMAGIIKDTTRSGARTPDLCDHRSPIPGPPIEAIYTPTMEDVLARQTENKATSPFPAYPDPQLNTPPPGSAIGESYPDKHHFTGGYYDHC